MNSSYDDFVMEKPKHVSYSRTKFRYPSSVSPVFSPPSSPISLGHAVRENVVTKVKSFLDEDADPNTQYEDKTPLYWSIQNKNLEVAKMLIDAGANTGGEYSESSPLHNAILQANIPMIKLLVENGANFLLHDGLITAIKKRNLEIVAELVHLGADVNHPNSESEFPIICAVRMMNFPMVRYLVEQKVDLNRKTNKDETALSVSLINNDFRTFQFLIESGADPKLASDVIEERTKTNATLAAYLSKVQKPDLKKSLMKQRSAQTAAWTEQRSGQTAAWTE